MVEEPNPLLEKAKALQESRKQEAAKDKPPAETPKRKQVMQVKVHSPFRTYFDDEAESISAMNETGPFDILPKHHNFMTLLSPGDILVRTARGTEKFSIARGIMHVKADQVTVFLDV